MKPIRLTIAGLQSYREEQTIDFAQLAEAGVFGIFGPTGSGKSTILDALTLAMYGSVERAGNSIQGIMNAQEDALTVSFAFQLADGGVRRTYRAERMYRRKTDGTVEQRLSRLSEETPEGTVVLADKAGEVNAAVEALIGLSMTDFTRAVVLPQGKFSEFLSLKGKERREMLQRLFRLERYGDDLAARLGSRLRGTEALQRETAAELQGLGDASPETLAAAERLYCDIAAEEARLQEALLAAEAASSEASRLREGMREVALREKEQTSLASRKEEMDRLEASLAAAESAEKLLPVWQEKEQADLRLQRVAAEAESAGRARVLSAEQDRSAREAHVAAERILFEQEAPTAVRLEQLRQAAALSEQALVEERALAEYGATLERLSRERDRAEGLLAEKRQQRAKAIRLQAELKAQLGATAVSSEERKRLAAADRQFAASLALSEQASAMRKEAAELAEAARRREAATARLDESVQTSILQLNAARELFLQGATALATIETGLQRWESRLGDAILEAKRAEAGGEWQTWALALAERLDAGEPCPVCGSAHHPAPAASNSSKGGAARRGAAARLEQLLASARELASETRKEAGRAQQTLHRLNAALGGEPESAARPADETAAAEEPSGAEPPEAWTESFNQRRRTVERIMASLRSVSPELQKQIDRLEASKAAYRDEKAALGAAVTMATAAETKAGAAEAAAAEAAIRWREAYPEWTVDTFAEALRMMEEKERLAEEVRQRLEKSEPFLEGNAAELEQLQQQLTAADRQFAQLEAESVSAERQLAARRADIAAIVGGAGTPPAELSAKLQAELEQWRADERAARAALEQARTASEEAGRRVAAAAEALKSAKEAAELAVRRWDEALAASDFADVAEAKRAILEPERRDKLQQEAAGYKEALASAAAKLDAARQRLGGKSVTEEAWAGAQAALAAVKVQREEALAARAKAERQVEELRVKHGQWQRLTRQHEEATALQQQLAKLQAVFRGNAFVEFLAEEQLLGVTRAASERLGQLTHGRYAIELDSTGGFVIRDDANGGVRRSVSTLSGGETFLTSLALALALSAQIQLGGKYPLEFFFLDEGFGTLDPDLLDNVITSLERLHVEQLAVGVISHVPELQARLPRKLIVTPADPMGAGSRVRMESM